MEAFIVPCAALMIALIVAFSVRRSYLENKELENEVDLLGTSILGLRPYKVASVDGVMEWIEFIPPDVLKQTILECIKKRGLLNTEYHFLMNLSSTDCMMEWEKTGRMPKEKSDIYIHKETNNRVEVVQWNGTKEAHLKIAGWEDRKFAEWIPHSGGAVLWLHTYDKGVMAAAKGDWVIRELLPNGNYSYSILNPEIFERRYDPEEGGE